MPCPARYRRSLITTILAAAVLPAADVAVDPVGQLLATQGPTVTTVTLPGVPTGITMHTRIIIRDGRQEQIVEGGRTTAEVPAVILDSTGLAVCGTAAIDSGGRSRRRASGARAGTTPEPEAKDPALTLTLPDGSSAPADLVLRDEALGLAVLRPREAPAQPLPVLALATAAEAPMPGLLDEVTVLSRYGKDLGRVARVVRGRVQAVLAAPQTGWILAIAADEGIDGCPAFDAAGRLLGLVLERTPDGQNRDAAVWLLPAAALGDLLERARAAPVPAVDDAGEVGF
jgi:hypothetical protein